MPAAVAAAIVAAATWISAAIGGAVAAAGAGIAIGGYVATVTFYAAEAAIYLGLGYAANALFGPKPPAPGSVQTPIKAAISPRRSGFGRARTSGVYACYEAKDRWSVDVLALHDSRVDGWESYYLHDDLVDVDPATGGVWCPGDTKKYAYGGPPGDRTFIFTRDGLATETAYPKVIDILPGIWTEQHRGDGVASLALVCLQSKDKFQSEDFPNGVPIPSAVGRLQRVFDPRDVGQVQGNPATYAWSDNPILALLAYLTDAAGGMGFDYAVRIAPHEAEWIAAANVCDELVDDGVGGTETRYRMGGVYMHDTDPAEVIGVILATCDGWLAPRGDGAFTVRAGKYAAPTVALTDAYVKAYQVTHFQPDEQAINEVVPSFTDPATGYQTADAGAVRDEASIEAIGKVRSQPLDLGWVQSKGQALRLARRILNRGTRELRGTLQTNLYGLAVLGERYLRLEIAENASLSNTVVEVLKVEIDLANLSVTFEWVEADPTIDTWTPAGEVIVSEGEPPARPTDPALAAPVIDTVTPVYEQTSSSDTGARLQVDITAPITADVSWLLRWRVVGDVFWHEAAYSDVDDGAGVTLISGFVTATADLEVEVAYRTAGATSPWSAIAAVTTAAPTTVFDAAIASVAAASAAITASEALSAGDLVNLHTVSGAVRMRKANATDASKPAHGFVKAAVANAAVGTFHGPGQVNDAVSGLTPGGTYWLSASTAGGLAAAAPSTSGNGDQEVGQALAADKLLFAPKIIVEAP